jgi:hypothetical protein
VKACGLLGQERQESRHPAAAMDTPLHVGSRAGLEDARYVLELGPAAEFVCSRRGLFERPPP